jgi:arylsulfatase
VQKPIEGVSMAYSFDDAKAPSTRTTQYFEMLGNRAIYSDGWVAATTPAGAPWVGAAPDVDPITGYTWELYHVAEDFSQANNLAAKQADKLKELQALFYAEAAKYDVLPIDNSKTARLDPSIRPSLTRGRTSFDFYEGMTRIPEGASPDVKNKSFTITAAIELPKTAASGVIVTQGGLFGGWALMVQQGRPVFHYNTVNVAHYEVTGVPLAPGAHTIVLAFEYDGGGIGRGGTATLTVGGKPAAKGRIERTIPIRVSLDEGLDIGEDTGTPVALSYDVPFRFTGEIAKVNIDLGKSGLSTAAATAVDRAGRDVAALRD